MAVSDRELRQAVERLDAEIETVGARLDQELAALRARCTALEAHAVTQAARLTALEDKAKVLEAAVAQLSADVDQLEDGYEALSDRVTVLEGEPQPPPPPPPGTRAILTQADFAYLGHYTLPGITGPYHLNYGQGFTWRRVGGKLRFLVGAYYRGTDCDLAVLEFEPPSAFGQPCNLVNTWPNVVFPEGFGAPGGGAWNGFLWDEPEQVLWSTSAVAYPNDEQQAWTRSIMCRKLNGDGTVSGVRGWWGLHGVGNRRLYGGGLRVPKWFQDAYGAGPYAWGFGGSASRAFQGLTISVGPTLYATRDPRSNPDRTNLLPFQTLMDHGAGAVSQDWYAQGRPTAYDRGVRNALVKNEMEAAWQSPAPDGLGRWTVEDRCDAAFWVDGPNKHGLVLVPSFASGRLWYELSEPHCEQRSAEIQVFDPAHLGEVARGSRPPWNVKPSSRWPILLPGWVEAPSTQHLPVQHLPVTLPGLDPHKPPQKVGCPWGTVSGAGYDPSTSQTFVCTTWNDEADMRGRIHVYAVSA